MHIHVEELKILLLSFVAGIINEWSNVINIFAFVPITECGKNALLLSAISLETVSIFDVFALMKLIQS